MHTDLYFVGYKRRLILLITPINIEIQTIQMSLDAALRSLG